MQCKARQRPCSFYKDGSLESDQQDHMQKTNNTNTADEHFSGGECSNSNIEDSTVDRSESDLDAKNDKDDGDDRIFFTDTSAANHNKLKRRGPLMESRISNTLGSLGENLRKMSSTDSSRLAEKLLDSTDTFGNFIMWMPEPSLPSRYSGSIEMPSREVQMALIDQFFNERYESIGLVPRYYFYEQLETKGLLITPLLLNIIYAHAARFVNIPNCPKTEVFYHRAKRLVDDFMDVPRVSTIVALCLLSLYEPSPAIYRPGAHHCRQWQYCGMACRMAIELGLYDDGHIHSSLTPVEIELRRRVFWGCYDLDKFHSGGWERPYMISKSFIKTLPPAPLPDESEDEVRMLNLYVARMQFISIIEDGLMLLCASQSFHNSSNNVFLGIHRDNMLENITDNHAQHQQWLRSLAPEMQWTPITTISVKDVLELPAPRPMVGHLHLYYNTVALELLVKIPSNSVTQFQSRVTAACMTQLVYHLCQTPSYITKFDFLVHSIIHAIKIHLCYLDDPDINLAQQAWLLFDRSIWCMQLVNKYAVIPNCTKFLQQVQSIYGLQMASANSENTKGKSSPKRSSATSLENARARQQSQSSSLISNNPQQQQQQQQQQQPQKGIQLTDKGSRLNTSSVNHSLHYNPDVRGLSAPTYMTNWTPTSQSQASAQGDQTMLQLGSNTSTDNMVYLDNRYRFSSHNRDDSSNSNLPQHAGFDQPPSNTTTTQLWPSSHHRQTSSSLDQQFSLNNRSESNDVLSYNTGDIVVPSQLLVDDNTSDNSIYQSQQSLQPSQPQQPQTQSVTNSPTRYTAQHLNTNAPSNLIWQDPGNSTNMNDDSNHANNNGLDVYMSSRQHYQDMIKR
ncbi:unnamed protein product [Mucor circinelloides]